MALIKNTCKSCTMVSKTVMKIQSSPISSTFFNFLIFDASLTKKISKKWPSRYL